VGYALGAPALVAAFDRVRNHFGLGRIVQAGALAALADVAHLASVRQQVEAARIAFGAVARDCGLQPLPSATNFLALDCGRDGTFARAVLQGLLAHGVFVRMPGVAPLDRCIRVSLGPAHALAIFAEALPGAVADARG
jgi:histidinol-phosphate aminotransferase